MKQLIKIIPIIVMIFFAENTFSQKSFTNLSISNEHGFVKYNPKITEIYKNKVHEDDGTPIYTLMKTKINTRKNVYYEISYFVGGSEVETYIISKINQDGSLSEIKMLCAEKIIIPGNGNIYVAGGTNTLFDMRLKYKLVGDKFVEVKQGAYYIGRKTKTQELITLYADKNKTHKSAVLPKNYDVEILLLSDGWFLIKTPFGLTGWISVKDVNTSFPYENHRPTFEGFFTL